MFKKEVILSILLIGLIVLARLLPHLPNVAPVAAAALVAGVYLSHKWALVVPLVGMFLSDLVVGFYNPGVMMSVYGSFALIGFISCLLKNHKSIVNIITASLGASLLFFIITNFAVWAMSSWYIHSLAGLLYAYELAIPFFRNTLMGDLIYTGILFGCFELAIIFQIKKFKVRKNFYLIKQKFLL